MAETTGPSSMTVRWEPVQTVKRGETLEYLLQSQCVGKDQDFVQVSSTVYIFSHHVLFSSVFKGLCMPSGFCCFGIKRS